MWTPCLNAFGLPIRSTKTLYSRELAGIVISRPIGGAVERPLARYVHAPVRGELRSSLAAKLRQIDVLLKPRMPATGDADRGQEECYGCEGLEAVKRRLGILAIATLVSLVTFAFWNDAKPPKPTPVVVVHASDSQPCPKRLLVGSYVYELVAGDPGKGDDGKPLRGSVNYEREVIIVDPDVPRDLKTETIVHELEHIAAQQSLQRTADYFATHKYRDDQWIEATAPILTMALRRYPELLTCELK